MHDGVNGVRGDSAILPVSGCIVAWTQGAAAGGREVTGPWRPAAEGSG